MGSGASTANETAAATADEAITEGTAMAADAKEDAIAATEAVAASDPVQDLMASLEDAGDAVKQTMSALFERLKGLLSGPELAVAASKCKELVGEVRDAELLAKAGAVCANAVDSASEAAGPVAEAVGEVMKDVEGYGAAALKAAVDAVPDEAKEKVGEMISQVGDKVTPEQASRILSDISGYADKLADNALLCAIGGALTENIGDSASEVLEVVVDVLGSVAAHLPYISIASGILGSIYKSFKKSKLEDENVRNCLLWTKSIVDWLMLVANRVEKSGAESSVTLFEELQKAMQALKVACAGFQNHWRITKMVVGKSFHEKLELAKQAVRDLKDALRDYLDAEATAKQDSMLGGIEQAAVQNSEKLDHVDAQLEELKNMMRLQQDARVAAPAQAAAPVEEVLDEKDEMFNLILKGANCQPDEDVPMDSFLLAFETIFLQGNDLEEEQSRGLAHCIDRNHDNDVSRAEWYKLYNKWKNSGLVMDAFLEKIAMDAPKEQKPVVRAGNGQFISSGNGDRMTVKGTVMQIFNCNSGDCVATVVNAMAPTFQGAFPWGQITMVFDGTNWAEVPGPQWVAIPDE